MPRKLTTKEFIEKAKKIHGNKYLYTYTNYVNNSSSVKIICKSHGIFEQVPRDHLTGRGCFLCGYKIRATKKTDTKETFIEKALNIHGEKYSYNNVRYVRSNEKVSITCKLHGDFLQKPNHHLSMKSGCPECAKENNNITKRLDLKAPSSLYYIKIFSNNKIYYKIGVTKEDILYRFRGEKKNGVSIEVLYQEYFKIGGEAYKKEKEILEKYRKYLTKDKPLYRKGNTEVFDKDVLGLDK